MKNDDHDSLNQRNIKINYVNHLTKSLKQHKIYNRPIQNNILSINWLLLILIFKTRLVSN